MSPLPPPLHFYSLNNVHVRFSHVIYNHNKKGTNC
uniref:Uncharacterized protein n=1 Tax=Rhizophora mucronata TaxID=61149 RepID=A0A2P2Q6E4_RHIMU